MVLLQADCKWKKIPVKISKPMLGPYSQITNCYNQIRSVVLTSAVIHAIQHMYEKLCSAMTLAYTYSINRKYCLIYSS